jgi:hypothetical protein
MLKNEWMFETMIHTSEYKNRDVAKLSKKKDNKSFDFRK